MLALLPMASVPVLLAILLFIGNAFFDRLLLQKVENDLAVANSHLQHLQTEISAATLSVAKSRRIRDLTLQSSGVLSEVLASREENLDFDLLAIVDVHGNVIGSGEDVTSGGSYLQLGGAARGLALG